MVTFCRYDEKKREGIERAPHAVENPPRYWLRSRVAPLRSPLSLPITKVAKKTKNNVIYTRPKIKECYPK